MWIRQVGERALLVEVDDQETASAWFALLDSRRSELAAAEVVPAARTVLIDGLTDRDRVADLLRSWAAAPLPEPGSLASAEAIVVPVRYDGPDLDEVARQWDLSTGEVVRLHSETEWLVRFCGFAPGFGYCTGRPGAAGGAAHPPVRRRSTPRTRVPAGSVALAGEFTGVYPQPSPGGWQLIGRTSLPLWRPDLDPPALLVPGRRVRFVEESRG